MQSESLSTVVSASSLGELPQVYSLNSQHKVHIPRRSQARPGNLNTKLAVARRLKLPPGLPKTPHSHPCSARSTTANSSAVLQCRQPTSKRKSYDPTELSASSEVYYLGLAAQKESACTDNESFQAVKHDHIAYRYEILGAVGHGSFGQVFAAYDHKCRRQVAVKVFRKGSQFDASALREIEMLKGMARVYATANYCTTLRHHLTYRGHRMLVFDLYTKNLREVLQETGPLSASQVIRIGEQLVNGLFQLHAQGVIHCDLKPENIMFADDGKLKIIDLGSACSEKGPQFKHVQSRYYRAPEVILGYSYTRAIDMWSLGCILVELLTGQPLFTGSDEWEQLATMNKFLGDMPPALLAHAPRKADRVLPALSRTPLEELVPEKVLLDFVQSCLVWEPSQRVTAKECVTRGVFSHK